MKSFGSLKGWQVDYTFVDYKLKILRQAPRYKTRDRQDNDFLKRSSYFC